MVFYRKYRSQTIDELDNANVRQTLTSVLRVADAPHAFLFTGPKGLGKTSTARIVAKAVNCERLASRKLAVSLDEEKKQELNAKPLESDDSRVMTSTLDASIEPCNTCEQCISITNGTNLDVMEIDAASNRGIDEMRDLREKIRLSPIAAKKKVYIIDEVHMLTTEAFNALLKTLEEPPAHAMFILCTTEAHKVPATILSRCFHIAFTLATTEELVRSFKRILKGEKIAIEDDALTIIATLSEGGFRDGAKILEELVLLANGEKITKSFVEEHYKTRKSSDAVSELITAFVKKDSKGGLVTIAQLVKEGGDAKYLFIQLLTLLHGTLLHKLGIENTEYAEAALVLSGEELKELVVLLTRSASDMKYAVVPSLPLELALIEWSNENSKFKIQNSKFDEKNGEKNVVEVTTETIKLSVPDDVSVSTLRKQVGNIAKIKALYGEEKEKKVEEDIKVSGISLLHASSDGEITKEWLGEFWRCIISEMKTYNHTIAGVLRGCMIKSFDRKHLIIETSFKFHKEKLDQRKTMDALENICKQLTGSPISVTIELKN